MAIGDDFSVAANGDIRHVSGATTYTVLELHRWLQDLADDEAAAGNDLIDITSGTPSERSTDNIITLNTTYNIDDTAAEFFYDGSVTQDSGATIYAGLVVVGSLYGTTTLQIVQNNGLYDTDSPFWGTGLNVDAAANILLRCLIKVRDEGIDIDGKMIRVFAREWGESYSEFSVTMGLGNNTAAIFTNEDINNATAVGTVATWTGVTNVEGYQGIDLNNGNGTKYYFSQWNRDSYTINQLYERCKWLVRRGTSSTIHAMDGELFRGITHELDYDNESGGPFQEDEVLAWGCTLDYNNEASGPFTVGEKLTFGTSNAVGTLLYLKDDGATGSMVVNIESGTPADTNTITGGTSSATAAVNGTPNDITAAGGTGHVIALDDNGADGTIWIQLLTGGAPVNNLPLTGATSDATCDVDGALTARTLSSVFLGQSTGTTIIGAYGIGVESADLSSSDKLTALDGTLQQPPNNVTFTVFGLVSGEDRVLVTNDDTGIDTDQMTLGTTLNGAAETTVDVGAGNIPADTAQTGVLRIVLDDGRHRRVEYLSHDGDDEFTIGSTNFTDPNDATSGNGVYLGYIDKMAGSTSEDFTVVYDADRTLFVRVRDGGASPIKTFETTGSLGTGGGNTTAIRQSDA